MLDEREWELIGQLGQALGLHADFVSQVQARGQAAIVDRTIAIDEIGAQSRLMLLLQHLGEYLEDRIIAGEPADGMDMLEAIEDFAEDVEIQPGMAVDLIGPVLDIFEQVTGLLMEGPRDGNGLGHSAGTRPGEDGAAAQSVR